MTKQLQTVYVPDAFFDTYTGVVHQRKSGGTVCVKEQSAYLYTPEEHAQVEKMREALEKIAGIYVDNDSKESAETYAIAQRALYLK